MNTRQMRRTSAKPAVLFAAIGSALAAASLLTVASAARAVAPGDIVLGDITVMRLRTASGGVSAEQRASMVQERVNEFLAIPNLTAKDVTIVQTKYGPTIYVHKIKLITVDVDTAKDQGTTPDVLAKTWAHRLMGVIAQVDIRVPGGPPAATPATGPITIPAAGAAPTGNPAAPATPPPANPAATPANPTAPATPPANPAPAKPTGTPPTPNAPAPPANPAPTPPAGDPPPVTPPATPPANPAPATPAAPAAPAPAPATPAAPGETSAPGGTS